MSVSSPPLPLRLPEARSSPWPRRLSLLGGALLGLILLVAAYAKLLDPVSFADQIRREGLSAPEALAFAGGQRLLAWLAIALEVGLGVALLVGVRTRAVLVASTLLVLLFLFLTGRTWVRELRGLPVDEASCGCFGNLVERTPAEAFWQDLLLLVPALGCAWLGVRPRRGASPADAVRRGPRRRQAGAAITAALAAGFAVAAPSLPLDDLATRARPGQPVAGICGGTPPRRLCLADAVPELAPGRAQRHWVVLADLEDPRFAETAGRLNDYARSAAAESEPLLVLTASPGEAQRAFFWAAAPAFEIREVPQALLRPLYRELPRSFRVEDGVIVETAAGLPTPVR